MDLNQTYDAPSSPEADHVPVIENGENEQNRCPRILKIQRAFLEDFWRGRIFEIHRTPRDQLKVSQLPLARVKRIMKGSGGAKMVSAETPAVMAKACEIFILELTMRSWLFTDDADHRTMPASDIVKAIRHDVVFDFLNDVAHRFDHDQPNPMEGARANDSTLQAGSSAAAAPQTPTETK